MNEQSDHASAPGGHSHDRRPFSRDITYLPTPGTATRDPRPGRERGQDEIRRRAAVIIDDRSRRGGLSETIRQLRRRGIPGYRAELIGRDDLDSIGRGGYEVVHLAADAPAALAALEIAGQAGLPVVTGAGAGEAAAQRGDVGDILRGSSIVLSPTRAGDSALTEIGVPPDRIARWEPGVDRELYGPARYSASAIPAPPRTERPPFNVLCTEAPEDPEDLDRLVRAFAIAREGDPRLRLVLAGSGPWQESVFDDAAVTIMENLGPDQLAQVYASADLFVSAASDDGFGTGVLRAHASGLPVLAIEGSGPAELIESGRNGCIVGPDADTLAAAIRGLARRATLRERLVTGGLLTARERTWERSLMDLAITWERALTAASSEVTRAA